MHIWTILQKIATEAPRDLALVEHVAGGASVGRSYRELFERASRLAGFLEERGCVPGDRVAICDFNSGAYIETYFAAAAVGAILCPLNVRASAVELSAVLEDCEPKWAVVRDELAPLVTSAVRQAGCPVGLLVIEDGSLENGSFEGVVSNGAVRSFRPPGGDGEPAHLYYTSGTTGRPKGVVLTHRNVTTHALGAMAELGISDGDRWGHIAPMFHLADAWAVFAVTWAGGRHVIIPRFEPKTVLEAIERHRVTLTNLVPTMISALLAEEAFNRADVSSLKTLLSGGAPIARAVVEEIIERFGCDYVQTYGMTETSPYLTLSKLKARHAGMSEHERLGIKAKTGRPFATVELEVVDGSGELVARDGVCVGQIRVRGDSVSPGYWRRPEETAEAFCDGWLHTGDLAVWDEEGYVEIVDRMKDMIITGGENVYCTEVEGVLFTHPAVREAAVFGVPDEKWGERVCAAVVPRQGAKIEAEELRRRCRAVLSGFKVPKSFFCLESLPKTGSGKISKATLRAWYKEQPSMLGEPLAQEVGV